MITKNRVMQDERGTINALLIPLILVTILFLGICVFAFWAFSGRQEYKNETDKIVELQVSIAKKETATEKDNEFTEKEKQPLKSYLGPSSFGGLVIKYPKTWSGYVDDGGKSGSPVDGYFHPTTVPGIQGDASYALRAQILDKSFSDEVKTFDSRVKNGKARASTYSNKNIPGVVGVKIEGEIDSNKQGIVILMPLRDKTVKIYTESDQFYNDFNNHILPNFSFTP